MVTGVSDIVYQSRIRIERVKGPLRRAWLPGESEPVIFGVHDEIAQHYQLAPGAFQPRAATLDYIVASAAG